MFIVKQKRTNLLIQNIQGSPVHGIGRPEPLKHGLSGYWSRRIDAEHRIVYRAEADAILIAQLRHHYRRFRSPEGVVGASLPATVITPSAGRIAARFGREQARSYCPPGNNNKPRYDRMVRSSA